jgi:hypothetical protein
MGRLHSENHGVTVIPTFRLVDGVRGVVDLDNADFNAARDDLEFLFASYGQAEAALARGDDGMLFPGYTLAMMQGLEATPVHKAAYRAKLASGEVAGPDPYAHEGASAGKVHLFSPSYRTSAGAGGGGGGGSSVGARGARAPVSGGGGGGSASGTGRRRRAPVADDDDGWSILGDDPDGGEGGGSGKKQGAGKGRRGSGGGGGGGNRVQ